jgi:peptidoglycan L-alanyl-D-glutamate endopeptidase CwlK
MAKFSKKSLRILGTVKETDLQTLFKVVIKYFDCTVVSGFRTQAEQQALYAQGRTIPGDIVTKADGVIHKSNHQSGEAVDVIPYPSLYSDKKKMREFGGFVLGVAAILKEWGIIDIEIEWGGHWGWDMPHFQKK